MQLGHALIKEQLFFRKELMERVDWFIRLRWLFAAAGFAAVTVLAATNPDAPVLPMTAVFCCIFCYNGFFWLISRQLRRSDGRAVEVHIRFAHVQISLDLAALFLIIYLTGGLFSPVAVFAVFHIIIAGILLSPASCYTYGGIILAVVGSMAFLQKSGLLPVHPPLFHPASDLYEPNAFQWFPFFVLYAAALSITAALTTSIKTSLQKKGRELLHVSKELEENNCKLTALYEMVKVMGSCSGLQLLMDSATRSTAKIMGVKGCSIKLLDDSGQQLRFASTYGLSGDYLAKGGVDVCKSAVNRSVIEGACHAVGNIHESDGFQYPEEIAKEGISSMVCLPLRVEGSIFGVFCVYSDVIHFFKHEDIRFFELISDLTALAIENLRSELNKTWFLQKAAHQLRSPLDTAHSIIKTLVEEYLGPLAAPQKETLNRLEKRIGFLRKMISDLLDLGIRRSGSEKKQIVEMDCADLLTAIVPQIRIQAQQKGIELEVAVAEQLPKIHADRKMVDDIFVNLISNALKYTPAGGKVSVSLAADERGRLRFRITDTGIGIPPEHLPRLFVEFSRAANAKAFAEEGSGLGMVIVKESVDRLKGSIHVSSKEAEGTTVTVLLPAESEFQKSAHLLDTVSIDRL